MDEQQERTRWKRLSKLRLDRKAAARRLRRAETVSTRHARKFLISRLQNARLVRREILIWATLIGFMIAGMGIQFAMSQRGYMQQAPARGGTYAEASLGPIDSLNPLYASSSAENTVARLLFSSLYSYDQTGKLHGDIATGLTQSQEGRVYTVTIRGDAKWHDGQPLTAEDIVYTVNVIKNPAARSQLRVNWLDVSVRAIDAHTVEFTLPTQYAAFPYALTFPILPSHLLASINAGALRESTFSQAPIGSGPFKYSLIQAADAITNHKVVHLTANTAYYRGAPLLDRFEVHAYATENDISVALKNVEVDGAADLPVVSSDEKGGYYQVTTEPIASGVYILLNTTNPILSDVRVRKALQIGTDTAAIRRAVGGDVKPLSLPFVDGQLTGADVPVAPLVNKAQAAIMLDEAGWKLDGTTRVKDGKPLQISITTTKDSQYQRAMDEVTTQWQGLGVVVEKRTVDASNVSTAFVQNVLQQRNFDALVYELSIGADPDVYAYWHSSQANQDGYNFTGYSNRNADAALASARARTETDLRNAKYKAFATQWLADAPAIGVYQPVLEYVVNKTARAVPAGANLISATDRFANVIYWSVNTKTVYKTP